MSVWTTKSLDRGRKYIVLKHTVPGVNNVVNGVRFRGGYAVVEKDSKTYHQLKRMPFLRESVELPLLSLKKLKFITRTSDIKMVFGQDVYATYLSELEAVKSGEAVPEQVVLAPLPTPKTCNFKTARGTLCKYNAMAESPSSYCTLHILSDPELPALGFEIPDKNAISKKDREKLVDSVIKKLRRGDYKKSEPAAAAEPAPVETAPAEPPAPSIEPEPERAPENG